MFDLSTLHYRFSSGTGRTITLAPTGEILSRIEVDPTTPSREAAYQGYNAALDQGLVARDGDMMRVALYNPYSGEVSLNSVPATTIYSAGRPIALDLEGTVFELDGEEMRSGEVVLTHVEPSVARTSRALAAHSY